MTEEVNNQQPPWADQPASRAEAKRQIRYDLIDGLLIQPVMRLLKYAFFLVLSAEVTVLYALSSRPQLAEFLQLPLSAFTTEGLIAGWSTLLMAQAALLGFRWIHKSIRGGLTAIRIYQVRKYH